MIMAKKEKNEKEKKIETCKISRLCNWQKCGISWKKKQDLLVCFYKFIGSPNFKTQKLYNFKIKKLKVHNITWLWDYRIKKSIVKLNNYRI